MSNKLFYGLLFIVSIIIIIGWNIDIMYVDSAQYASMSMEMLKRGDWLKFYDRNIEYLDKPPLVFWTAGLSYLIFGINQFAYRLPSFIFTLLAWFGTYKLTELYYSKRQGQIATLLLASCQAVFMMNHDCRTDTLLLGAITMALYGLLYYSEKQEIKYFFIGVFFIGMALLAKGPIGIMIPIIAYFTQIMYTKKYYLFIKPINLIGLVVIAILLFPMCYGLYEQFGTEGLTFYFWTQSFGRLTGENVWNNNAPPTFLFESLQWALIPWTIWIYPAFWLRFKAMVGFNKEKTAEWFSFSSFMVALVALSSSKYQLPHYIFVTLPLVSIMASGIFERSLAQPKKYTYFTGTQWVLNFLLLLFFSFLASFAFGTYTNNLLILEFVFLGIIIWAYNFYTYYFKKEHTSFIFSVVITACFINIFLNVFFYPNLLVYQSSSVVGRYLKENNISKDHFIAYKFGDGNSIDFYSKEIQDVTNLKAEFDVKIKNKSFMYVFTDTSGLNEINKLPYTKTIIKSMEDYPVTQLSIDFVNKKTRMTTVKKTFLLKLENLEIKNSTSF